MQEEILKSDHKANHPRIGLDLMGSDTDPNEILESVLPILENLKNHAHFTLFGEKNIEDNFTPLPHVSFHVCTESISMRESPLQAIRTKKGASLNEGIKALKTEKIQAFISMGNTGALLAAAKAQLGTLPSITRPALLALIPTKKTTMAVLDVGANIDYTGSRLLEFAAIGSSYQKAHGIQNPTIGLLNIGTEETKGPEELQKAYHLLTNLSKKHSYPLFLGNIEGRDVLEGPVDVLVAGGFYGNIFLKTLEGAAHFFLEQIKKHSSLFPHLQQTLDYQEQSGATLCGINAVVIKCHGNAKPKALQQSLINAIQLVNQNFIEILKKEISLFFASTS